jgi:chemosensory pili system protein ChpA (sensor histidine kinase/response regulator)
MNDASAFAEELEEVALQLSSLDLTADTLEAMASVAAQTLAEYERLGMTASLFGMEGVQQTAEWIHRTLAGFQHELPDAILELLQGGQLFGWIELTAIALREPEEPSHLSAISAELLGESWPEPIAADILANLLLNLRTPQPPVAEEPIPTEKNPLSWDEGVHPELLEAYLQETPGQIAEACRLIHLIAKDSSNTEQKRHAARLAHTVKGASGVVGVAAIAAFTHRLEDILDLDIGKHLTNGLGATLEAAADCLETLFEHLQEHKGLPTEYHTLLADMDEWEERLQTTPETNPAIVPELPEQLAPVTLPDFITNRQEKTTTPDETTTNIPRSSTTHLSVPIETVQRLLNLTGELITSTSQIAEHVQQILGCGKQLHKQDEHIRQMLDELGEAIDQQSADPNQASPANTANADTHDKQNELEGYNELYSTTNLLTESIADNRALNHDLQQQIRQISEQVYQQQRLQRQLSETILRTRLIPVQSIVARMERTVRETCRRTGKQAEITIHGQNLQVDTDILQGLTPPLLHMLRNAIDHGIETPEQRQQVDKPAAGQITLRFEQKGSHIHMSLSDDGRGLDVSRIRARALERGLIKPDETLDEEASWRLILHPGFSTREEVSEISGRGVGLDVVQSAVEDLQGLLNIESIPGQGISIHIHVPLTLIATHALIVRSGGNLLAIPGSTIKQLLYVSAQEHITENEAWHILYQENRLEVLQLAQLLGWVSEPPDFSRGHSLLIVESEHKLHALYVEEILQPRDIVVKSLAPWLNLNQGISGACILANGAVAPVLDTLRLLRNFDHGLLTVNKRQTLKTEANTATPRILIVDDSLSNRTSVSLMIEQMGYQAITAVDGLDALQRLHEQAFTLVLTDLEMPRMNGLEMTQAIRIWPERQHLPVIMITSRSTHKYRQMAQQAGVDDYLTKPVSAETLKRHVQKWLRTQLTA